MNSLKITIGWCTQFKPRFRYQSLLHANRPPALFAQRLGKLLAAASIQSSTSLVTDEYLGVSAVEPDALATVSSCDVAFLSSHGSYVRSDYRFRLRNGEWIVSGTVGNPGPAVLVLDTCDLIDAGKDFAKSSWLCTGQLTPAIVLGFIGGASDGYQPAKRGDVFAENLALGSTFAIAWIDAVKATSTSDRPIAVAFGPTITDAKTTLESATLMKLPKPTYADNCYWTTR